MGVRDVPKTHIIVTKHYLANVVSESKRFKSITKKNFTALGSTPLQNANR